MLREAGVVAEHLDTGQLVHELGQRLAQRLSFAG